MSYISVDVDLSDIDEDDLLLELQYRHRNEDKINLYVELFHDKEKQKIKLFLNNMDRFTIAEIEELFKEKITHTPIPKEQLSLPI